MPSSPIDGSPASGRLINDLISSHLVPSSKQHARSNPGHISSGGTVQTTSSDSHFSQVSASSRSTVDSEESIPSLPIGYSIGNQFSPRSTDSGRLPGDDDDVEDADYLAAREAQEEYRLQREIQQQLQHRLRSIERRNRPATSHGSSLFARFRKSSARSPQQYPHRASLSSLPSSSQAAAAAERRPRLGPEAWDMEPDASSLLDSPPAHVTTALRHGSSADSTTTSFDHHHHRRGGGIPEDQMEASQRVWVWRGSEAKSPSASSNALSKTVRDVRSATRRLGKRDVVAGSSPSYRNNPLAASSSPTDASSPYSQSSSWLNERSGRTKVGNQMSSGSGRSGWKAGMVNIKENGHFYVYGENETLLHPILASQLAITDVRPVEKSLLNCSNVLGIFACPSVFSGSAVDRPATSPGEVSVLPREEPIYIRFESSQKLRYWMALLRSWADPEIYGSAESSSYGGTHRWYRQIDLNISTFKILAPSSSSRDQDQRRAASPLPSPVHWQSSSRTSIDNPPHGVQPPSPAAATFEGISGGASISATDTASTVRPAPPKPRRGQSATSDTPSYDDGRSRARRSSSSDMPPLTASTSTLEPTSGPIAGNASRDPRSPSLFTVNATMQSPGLLPMTGRSARQSRREGSGADAAGPPQISSAYCVVYIDGLAAGETASQPAEITSRGVTVHFMERMCFEHLPAFKSLRVDVYQPPTASERKRVLVGSAELPIESLMRGRDVSGSFPIWTSRVPEREARMKGPDNGAMAFAALSGECVGELALSLTVQEDAVMKRSRYAEVDKILASDDSVALMSQLAEVLPTDSLVPLLDKLVMISISRDRIIEFLSSLLLSQASAISKHGRELLFRENSLLSRSLDKYQRIVSRDWLETSIGPVVRDVWNRRIVINEGHLRRGLQLKTKAANSGTFVSTDDVDEEEFDDLTECKRAVKALKEIMNELWEGIYANRHCCPSELRHALSEIRTIVNSILSRSTGSTTGMQGVGAFVFLRLFCPALMSPHLFGLVPSKADDKTSKTFVLLAKALMMLAKDWKQGDDAGKQTDSQQPLQEGRLDPIRSVLGSWLQRTAPAYEDYITVVSSLDPHSIAAASTTRQPGVTAPLVSDLAASLDEDDRFVHHLTVGKKSSLCPLHREAIGEPPYLVDGMAAMAGLVTLVADHADLVLDQVTPLATPDQQASDAPKTSLKDFVTLCCTLEAKAGRFIDRAGFNPSPLPVYPTLRPDAAHWSGGTTIAGAPWSTVSTGRIACPSPKTETLKTKLSDASRRGDRKPVAGQAGSHPSDNGKRLLGSRGGPGHTASYGSMRYGEGSTPVEQDEPGSSSKNDPRQYRRPSTASGGITSPPVSAHINLPEVIKPTSSSADPNDDAEVAAPDLREARRFSKDSWRSTSNKTVRRPSAPASDPLDQLESSIRRSSDATTRGIPVMTAAGTSHLTMSETIEEVSSGKEKKRWWKRKGKEAS